MKGLYDIKGNVFHFEPVFLDRGSVGTIYKIGDNTCLKKFDEWALNNLIITFAELEIIKKLKLSHIYEIYDFLYNANKEFAGYTMKFYQSEDMDMFTVETHFILDNFISIYKSVMDLSKHNICLRDMHAGNIIVNKREITLIDLDDSYFGFNNTFEDIIKNNRNQIANILKTMFYKSLRLYYGFDFVKLYDESAIRELSKKVSVYGIEALCEELEGYKYPIDYVKSKIKTI